jgi:hypothetical protein
MPKIFGNLFKYLGEVIMITKTNGRLLADVSNFPQLEFWNKKRWALPTYNILIERVSSTKAVTAN